MQKQIFRIQKLISSCGYCSRRKAEELIINKKVKINGEIALLGQKVTTNDIVEIDNTYLDTTILKEEKVYYLLNKPKKTICTLSDPQNRQTVIDLINDNRYLFPVGRLDYNTTGVLLITNDGEMANKLIHPSMQIQRIYRARLNEKLTYKELVFLNSKNVIIDNKKSKQIVQYIDHKAYYVYLWEGTNHHVKKIFALVNKNVLDLKRVEFANLKVDKIPLGGYRKLKPNEIKGLKLLIKNNEEKNKKIKIQ